MTPRESANAIGKIAPGMEREVPNGIRRVLGFLRRLALTGYRSKGVGRAIWGEAKLTTLRPLVKRGRVVRVGSGWTAGLEVRGLAALMETGGKTLAHDIKSKGGKLWKHPGSRIPQNAAAVASLPAAEAQLLIEMDKAVTKAVIAAGLYSD